METMSISETRAKLPTLAKLLPIEPERGPITVTKRNKPVLSIIPWETYEALTETIEIMSDELLMKDLKKSIREVKNGDTVSLEKTKSILGLE